MKIQQIQWVEVTLNGSRQVIRSEKFSPQGELSFHWSTKHEGFLEVFDKKGVLIELLNLRYIVAMGIIEGEIVPSTTPPPD
jgi:hypothetical protein